MNKIIKTLKEQLEEKKEDTAKMLPIKALDIMQSAIDQLSEIHIIDTAVKTGDSIPKILLPNIKGEKISVQEILKDNRVLLVFYRGGWCPYCNLELQAFQELLSEFEARGVKVIAISPETIANGVETADKNQLGFEVLSDMGNVVTRDFGLVYKIPNELAELYVQFGINLKENQGNVDNELPIAATYVIEQSGKISYHFLDEDYKKRAEPKDILEIL